MAYDRDDRRYGRDPQDRGRYGDPRDRGFFERAGDEVRSWFGDEDAERRRRRDEREDDRYDRGGGGGASSGRYAQYDSGGYRGPESYPSWNRSNRDEGFRRGGQGYGGYDRQSDEGRQFDTSPGYDYNTNRYGRGDAGREAEYRATYGGGRQGGGQFGGGGDRYEGGRSEGSGRYEGGGRGDYGARFGRSRDDDHDDYQSWRDRQMSAIDRDYHDYRRENRTRFESEFSQWRQNRQSQRDALGTVKEHQEVVGSDGTHVGTVDHVRGDHLLLTKTDRDADGHHHAIPSMWIATVDDKVHLSKTAADAKRAWREADEEAGRSGRDDDDGRGGNLNRSFSGTY